MARVAPSERFRVELDEVLAGVGQEQDPVETIGRLGARLILQQALEDEVTEFLGRVPYERNGEVVAHRNGYEPRTVRTTSGKGTFCCFRGSCEAVEDAPLYHWRPCDSGLTVSTAECAGGALSPTCRLEEVPAIAWVARPRNPSCPPAERARRSRAARQGRAQRAAQRCP